MLNPIVHHQYYTQFFKNKQINIAKKVKYPRLQIKSNFVKQSRYIIIIDGTIQFITIILYCLLLNNA